jgi:hypothetical protein
VPKPTVITSEYLSRNKDIFKFLTSISDTTGRSFMGKWTQNLRDNRELFRQCDWAATRLADCEKGKTAIIMGSSPAIRNQVDQLREIQNDPEFVMCGLSSNLEFLLNNGIQPKYLITVDADESTGSYWDNLDMDKTKDITLVANIFAYPPMLKKWKGPLYFISLGTADKKFARKIEKWYGPANGNGAEFPALVAQFNMIAAISFLIFGCPILLFVGNELSFKDEDSRYYMDREDFRDKEKRFPHGDIYGDKVHTTYSLLAVKYVLEGFLEVISGAGWFINCTEAGIFGITKRFPDLHVPWIHQLTLKNGIAQARQIMRTGEPFLDYANNSMVVVPNMASRVSWNQEVLQ